MTRRCHCKHCWLDHCFAVADSNIDRGPKKVPVTALLECPRNGGLMRRKLLGIGLPIDPTGFQEVSNNNPDGAIKQGTHVHGQRIKFDQVCVLCLKTTIAEPDICMRIRIIDFDFLHCCSRISFMCRAISIACTHCLRTPGCNSRDTKGAPDTIVKRCPQMPW